MLFAFSHCAKEVEKMQNYTATVITESQSNFVNTPPDRVNIDTSNFDIFMSKDEFIAGNCKGTLNKTTQKIEFSTTDCGCWCDCNPLVDCIGHIILGSYDFQKSGDDLILTFENIRKINNPNFTIEQKFKKTVSLKIK